MNSPYILYVAYVFFEHYHFSKQNFSSEKFGRQIFTETGPEPPSTSILFGQLFIGRSMATWMVQTLCGWWLNQPT